MGVIVQKEKGMHTDCEYAVTNEDTNETVWVYRLEDGWEVMAHLHDDGPPFDKWLDGIGFFADLDDAISCACDAVDDRI